MSGNQTSTTNQTQTQVANPVAQAALSPFGPMGLRIAQTPYQQAMNPQVAALTPMQQQAIQGLGGLQTNNPASSYINQANQYSQLAANPQNVVNMAQQFYNPMASAVEAQLGNIFGQQNAQLLGNAAASGAVGGSRYGVAAGNLANQQGLAAGQTLAGLQQQALNAAQTEQGQISQQAFTQGQLGQEALNTQIQGINQALLGGQITQQQAQALLNAAQQGAIQQTLFPQQEAAAGENIAMGTTALGGTTYGQGQTTQPVNYLGQILGAGIAGYGLYSSDERVKENIKPIGKSFDGQKVYLYNYIGDPSPRIGLMASEVQKKHPSAVKKGPDGIKAVDYNKATAKSVQLGEHRQHRAIGGGTGIGNGVSGIEGFGGLQSGLAPYFAQSPQVQIPPVHFPTLNLNSNDPNAAQKQADQNAQQMMALGKDLSHGHIGSDINTGLGNLAFGSGPTTSDGGWSTSTQPSGGFLGGLGDYFGYRDGGRIHRQSGGPVSSAFPQSIADAIQKHPDATSIKRGPDGGHQVVLQNGIGIKYPGRNQASNSSATKHREYGGPLSLSPDDKAQLDYLRGGAPSWLGGDASDTPSPPIQPIGPSTLERFLNERRTSALHASPQDYGAQPETAPSISSQPLLQKASLATSSTAPTMGQITPDPFAYHDLNPDGSIVGAPKPIQDRLQQPVQQAAIASPAQAPTPAPLAPPAIKQPDWGDIPHTPQLANDRQRFAEELRQNPALRQKYLTISLQEQNDPTGNLAIFETAMNRASVNHTTLADELRMHNTEGGYYGGPYRPELLSNPRYRQMAEMNLERALSGSNVAKYGTDNSSGDFGRIRNSNGMYTPTAAYNGEYISYPSRPDARGYGNFPDWLNAVGGTIQGGLHDFAGSVQGGAQKLGQDINALPGQIGEGIRGVFGGGQKPQSVLDRADLQPPKPGESNLDQRLREFGFNVGQPQGLGGSLGRALGIQGGLDPQTSNRLVNMGLGMMAAGPTVGVKGFPGAAISALTSAGKGGQFALGQEQQERAQAINLANAAMNQQKQQWEMQKPQHAGTAVSYDINGMPKYNPLFQRWNPETKNWEWIQGPEGSVGPSGNPIDANVVGPNSFDSPMIARKAMVDAQAKGTRGDDFIKTLPPTYADLTRAALSGSLDVSRENDRNAPQNKIVRELALQADPDFRPDSYKYAEAWRDPKGVNGQARIAFPTAIDHMEIALRNAQNIPDHKGSWTSKTQNEFSLWQARNRNDPWYTAQLENNTLLADEVAKIAVASRSGSALADRQANERALDMSQGRTAYIQTLQRMSELMASKGEAGMQGDWKKNMSKLAQTPDILSAEDKARVANIKQAADNALKGKKEQTKATQEQQQSTAEQAEGLKRRVEQSFKSVPKPQGLTDEQIIAKAREGIADGTRDPELVRKQLKSWGLNLD